MGPHAFALIVLLTWPLVAIIVVASRRGRSRLARTAAWMMILPVMFLPAGFYYDPPLLPYLDKHRVSFLALAVALRLIHGRDLLPRAPGHQFPRLVLALLFAGVVGTVRTNQDVLTFGPTTLPALTSYDTLAMGVGLLLDYYLPFWVGQRVFRTEQDVRDLLEVLTVCALVYVPFCLVELRLSPQFHSWIYGYHPSDFIQTMRGDGYRPVVFMNHGLSVAMFFFSALVAALGLDRARLPLSTASAAVRAAVIGALVLLCKSLGAILYSSGAVVLRFVSTPKTSARVMVAIVALVIAYPALRASQKLPTADIIALFERVSAERAASLAFRFENEDALIARAMERPIFGWGGFGRGRVWAEWGGDVSVTDGYWIIVLGSSGLIGLAGFLALMVWPILRYVRLRPRMTPRAQVLLGTLALLLSVSTLDLLPNSRSDFLPMAFAGALFTLSERLARQPVARVRVAAPDRSMAPPSVARSSSV